MPCAGNSCATGDADDKDRHDGSDQDMTADWTPCARLAQSSDPERFSAIMAALPHLRGPLFSVLAAHLEIARAPWAASEPMLGEIRLRWWHDALEEIATGAPVRRHEVTTPLAEALDAPAARRLQESIAAREADLNRSMFSDNAALWTYLEATSGALYEVLARSLGAPQRDLAPARRFGTGAGLAAWLRAVPELEARGWPALPDTDPAALRALANEGLAKLTVPRLAPETRAALRLGYLARPVLRTAQRSPEDVMAGALAPSPFTARRRLLWLTATKRA